MKNRFRLDYLFGSIVIFSFFIPMFWPAYPFMLSSNKAVTNFSVCVSWKDSIAAAYSAFLLFLLVVPFYWVSRFQLGDIKLGIGHFIGSLSLSLFGSLILVFGFPFTEVERGGVMLAKLYCSSPIGSLLILSCIGLSIALFFSYFLLVVKYFLLRKWS